MEIFVGICVLFSGSVHFKRHCLPARDSGAEGDDIIQVFSNSQLIRSLVNEVPFVPPLYVKFDYHGQLQTVWQTIRRTAAALLLTRMQLRYERELLRLSDGGTLGIDTISLRENMKIPPTASSKRERIVVLCHGLCGDSTSEYLIHFAHLLLKSGYKVMAVVSRGCGGVPFDGDQPLVPHKDNETDLQAALRHIRRQNPTAKLFAIGFSLGAANLLIEVANQDKKRLSLPNSSGRSSPRQDIDITAAMCVSPPWNMLKTTSVFYLWNQVLTGALKLFALTHAWALSKAGVSIVSVLLSRNLTEFDQHFVKFYGYETVDEYREAFSPIHKVNHIRTPTLVVSAEDDPVCCISSSPDAVEDVEMGGSEGLSFVKTRFGGHLGFQCQAIEIETPREAGGAASEDATITTTTWIDALALKWFNMF